MEHECKAKLEFGLAKTKESSFVSANVECLRLGSFRVPLPFHKQFGRKLPSRLKIRCKSNIWTAKYDTQFNCIYGLRTFVKFYGIRIFSIVQFDYYGSGLFNVKIYKESAIECHYPLSDPIAFKKSEAAKVVNEDQFLVNYDSLEYDKQLALITFNGFLLDPPHVQIDIMSMDIDPRNKLLILNSSYESFYKKWEHKSKVNLRFIERTWEIDIEWRFGRCLFRQGWVEFATETELAAGDSLILYKFTNDDQLLNVCIIKGDQYVNDHGEGSLIFPRSFYKVVTPISLDDGLIIVPKLVKEKYSDKLNQINVMEVFGVESSVFYNQTNGCLKGLKKITDMFEVRQKDTIFFTMEQDSKIVTARIYGVDGMEIDYLTHPLGLTDTSDSIWFWHIDWPSDDESETEECMEEEVPEEEAPINENYVVHVGNNNDVNTFSTALSKCHVNNRTQGVNIPRYIAAANREWISGEKVLLRKENRSWNVGLAVNNGRARFSAGWNKFAKDNELRKRQILVFNMIEGAEGIIFDVTL